MIASVLIYLGVLLTILGLAALVFPHRLRARHGKTIGLFAALVGIGLSLLGVGMPARDTVVGQPRERLDAVMPHSRSRSAWSGARTVGRPSPASLAGFITR